MDELGGLSAPVRGHPPLALRGRLWPGGDAPAATGVVVVDRDGTIVACGPDVPVRQHVPVVDVAWIGPAVTDFYATFAPLEAPAAFRRGLAGARTFTAGPLPRRRPFGRARPVAGLHVAGWLAPADIAAPAPARAAVRRVLRSGAAAVTMRVDGAASPPDGLLAAVAAAHDAGVPVLAHADAPEAVRAAVAAGVDELARVPAAALTPEIAELLAVRAVAVTSTLQAYFAVGAGAVPALNAALLHRHGVPLRYGSGTLAPGAGVDPRELDRLADAGLGRLGALRAATAGTLLRPGVPAALVGLADDPLVEPAAWRWPVVVVRGREVSRGGQATG